MYAESELLPLSGLQHFTFCERRWALVHIEMIWEDNRFTTEGSLLHERAHSGELESRPSTLVRRALPVRSFSLGLSGQADVIEFTRANPGDAGVLVPGKTGLWRAYPIEYKRKRGRGRDSAYHVQLCAQAMCLEEMFAISIDEGAIYDGTARRRQPVLFTLELRATVEKAAGRMHELFRLGATPPPVFTNACKSCSLIERCQPRTLSSNRSVSRYLSSALDH